MKIRILIISFLFISIGWSQNHFDRHNPTVDFQTNIQRYNKDYELVDESALISDSSILEEINLFTIDALRINDEDLIINYRGLNIEIIIYSRQKAIENNAYFTEPLNK